MKMNTVVLLASIFFAGFIASAAMPESAPRNYQVAERGADFKVMRSIRAMTNGVGVVTQATNSYTVLGNGMNKQDASGNWTECVPVVQNFPSGIICTGANYQVILKKNLNRQGSVDVETSDKSRMVSHPLAIAYYDPDTGRREWIANIKDCQAETLSNKVIYANAFAGRGIEAAVVYTYDRGRFEQDVIFTKKPGVSPADLGMGGRARIEVVTEIMQAPTPARTNRVLKGETNAIVRAQRAEPDLVDESLEFSKQMRMPLGYAFPNNVEGDKRKRLVPVAKRLRTMVDGRTVLTEAVEWSDVIAELDKLPTLTAGIGGAATKSLLTQAIPAPLVADRDIGSFETRLTKVVKSGEPQIASNRTREPVGFVVDYQILQSSYGLSPGTYLVEDWDAYVAGPIGGDVVIKFRQGASLRMSTGYPNVSWVLTASDDDSAGEIIADSTGTPDGYYGAYFNVDGIMWDNFGNVDCRYMNVGMDVVYDNSFSGDNWTFRHCDVGLRLSANYVNLYVQSFYACDTATPYNAGNNNFSVTVQGADCDGDLDNNGLDDGWEVRNFGSTGQNSSGDPDNDGLTNLQEQQGGTNPNLYDSAFGLSGTARLKVFTPLK